MHFRDWVSDLRRMQREHIEHCDNLCQRLRNGQSTDPRPAYEVVAPVATPPVYVQAPYAWAEPTNPITEEKPPQPPVTCTAVEDISAAMAAVKIGTAPPPQGSSTPLEANDKGDSKRRFSDPINLLYGVEREEQHKMRSNRASVNSRQKEDIRTSLSKSFTTMKERTKSAPAEPSKFQQFVRSPGFRAVCSFVILANALFMGFAAQAQLQANYARVPVPRMWEYLETSFAVFFMAELLLRLAAERAEFLFSEDAPWNVFDTFLVLLSIFDIVLSEFTAAGAVNLSFARTLRIFRFARILRIVRVFRFFYSFRLMVYSVLYSIVSLFWVLIMLVFVMYFFAIFFMHGVTEYFKFDERTDSSLDVDLVEKYGTLHHALLSLFMAISGGIDWTELLAPLAKLGWVYGFVFFSYIFFMVFGVLNVVMASFVDSATQISRKDRELVTRNEIEKNQQYAQHIRRFFHEADTDGTGTLSWEEFEEYLQNDKVQAYFQSFELDVSQARTLFKLLDLDESNDVGIDEFIQGCMRMKGSARSIDVNMLLYEIEKLIERQVEFMGWVAERLPDEPQAVGEPEAAAVREAPPNTPSTSSKLRRKNAWHALLEERPPSGEPSILPLFGLALADGKVKRSGQWFEADV